MGEVFVLSHTHVFEEGYEDWKLIGVFSVRQLAEEACGRSAERQGFSEAPEGFDISCLPVVTGNAERLSEVSLLLKILESPEGDEVVTLLGAFPTEADAEAAQSEHEPAEASARLEVCPRTLDEESWLDGYVTVEPDEETNG